MTRLLFLVPVAFLALAGLSAGACVPPPSVYLTSFLPLTGPLNNTDVYSYSSEVISKAITACLARVNTIHAQEGLPSIQSAIYDVGASSSEIYAALHSASLDTTVLANTLFMHGPLTGAGDNALEHLAQQHGVPFFDQHPYESTRGPLFFRLSAQLESFVSSFTHLLTLMGVSKVSFVAEDAGTFSSVAGQAIPMIRQRGFQTTFVSLLRQNVTDRAQYEAALDALVKVDNRFVVTLLTPASFARFTWYAHQRNMLGTLSKRRDPYVLIGPFSEVQMYLAGVAAAALAQGVPLTAPLSVPAAWGLPAEATMKEVLLAASGGPISLSIYGLPDAEHVAEVTEAFVAAYGALDNTFNGHTAFTADWIFLASDMMRQARLEGRLCELTAGSSTARNSTYVVELLRRKDYHKVGPSGVVAFSSTNERETAVVFYAARFDHNANASTVPLTVRKVLVRQPANPSSLSATGSTAPPWSTADDLKTVLPDPALLVKLKSEFVWNTVDNVIPPHDTAAAEQIAAQDSGPVLMRILVVSLTCGLALTVIVLVVLAPYFQARSYKRLVLVRSEDLQHDSTFGHNEAGAYSQDGGNKAPRKSSPSAMGAEAVGGKVRSQGPSSSAIRAVGVLESRLLHGVYVSLQPLSDEPLADSPFPQGSGLQPLLPSKSMAGRLMRMLSRGIEEATGGMVAPTSKAARAKHAYGIRNRVLPWQLALTVLLKRFQSRNVVQVIGVTEDAPHSYSLVMEELLVSFRVLSHSGFQGLKLKKKAQLIRDVLSGVLYLSEVMPYSPKRPMLKYGIRPSMVYIDRYNAAKIVPTGTETMQGELLEKNGQIFSIFIPPEVLRGSYATQASDVFTVGVMIWMLLNNVSESELTLGPSRQSKDQAPPLDPDTSDDASFNDTARGSGSTAVNNSLLANAFTNPHRLNLPWRNEEALPRKVIDTVNKALSFSPTLRPSINELMQMTQALLSVRAVGESHTHNKLYYI